MDACAQAGGGTVYLGPGKYLSGTIVVKSNVTFHLEAVATLLGSMDLADYVPQAGPPATGDANGNIMPGCQEHPARWERFFTGQDCLRAS